MEGAVLLWVEHLQQGAGGVAVMRVLRHLVNLVEDEDGVRAACLLNVLDDAARHGTNVGATVSANLGLVVQTTQRDAHIFTLQGVGNRLAQRGLTHAWRAIETEDRTLQVATQ